MKNIEGLYTAIAALINTREQNGLPVMSVESLVDDVQEEVDVYSADFEWYVHFALRAAVCVGLYQKGYRAVVKGKGLFVNPHLCGRIEYVIKQLKNARMSASEKAAIVRELSNIVKELEIPGQMTMDLETGECVEGMTDAELLAALQSDAEY